MVNYAVDAGGLDNITVAITPYPVASPAESHDD
jgi:hypothetical protein